MLAIGNVTDESEQHERVEPPEGAADGLPRGQPSANGKGPCDELRHGKSYAERPVLLDGGNMDAEITEHEKRHEHEYHISARF